MDEKIVETMAAGGCLSSAEAGRILSALRAAGYDVVPVEAKSEPHLSNKPEVIDGCECPMCQLHRRSK